MKKWPPLLLCGSQRYLRLRLGGLADDVPVTLGHGVLLADVRTVDDIRRMTAWPTRHRLVVERVPIIEMKVELP